ncbi:hypothetical protein Tco_1207242, partial [Tanacetum coccineum]
MLRDDPVIERIPRRSLKKRNITPSKNELPHWHCKKDKRWPEYPYHAKRDSIYEGVGSSMSKSGKDILVNPITSILN